MYNFRTDLALERKEILGRLQKEGEEVDRNRDRRKRDKRKNKTYKNKGNK